jgi:RNA polymerase sigma factor (sigma-70 family)
VDIERLAKRYSNRIVGLARSLIHRYGLQARIDPEDVANAMLYELHQAASKGNLPEHQPGDGLWRFTRLMVVRKIMEERKRHRSLKRGGSGRDQTATGSGDEPLVCRGLARIERELDTLPCRRPSPEQLVAGAMELERMIQALDEPSLRRIALLRFEGHTVEEIANRTKRDPSTIKRKLQQIRTIWNEWGPRN